MKTWHQLSIEDTFSAIGSNQDGLTSLEVDSRRKIHGANIIPGPKGKSILSIFGSQFLSPLIYVLIAAALISALIGELSDALFILIIITINAILGSWQEYKAESSAEALQKMVRIQARIRRDGKIITVDAEDLVPGDLVLLEPGIKIPADLRLVKCNELLIEESLLTGESQAILKDERVILKNELAIGDQVNMAFAATAVLKGRGTGLVVQTGISTEIGKIASSLTNTKQEKPPLVKRMDVFAKNMSIAVLVICIVLGLVGYLQGIPVTEIFFFMVAAGVSAIPEGLPVALTVALAIGTNRMARKNVIVRNLPAVEGLGSCTLIASDKTGTLTMDQQSVKTIYLPDGRRLSVSGNGYNGIGKITGETGETIDASDELLFEFIQAALLSNEGILRKDEDSWEYSGDAVDVALSALAFIAAQTPAYFSRGISIVHLLPYESENKFSGVFYTYREQLFFSIKGAVETVLKFLPATLNQKCLNVSEDMAKEGYRVLALATGIANAADLSSIGQLELNGLVGLMDPIRPEAIQATKTCQEAGIEVVMVTGDHPATALTIANRLGIAESYSQLMTGKELAVCNEHTPELLQGIIAAKTVFARVTPLQKKLIVDNKKSNGHYIAVTGDGANDAPALKSAHIGIAMGSGTDLTKDNSSIIISDNNFASIAAGVEEGRNTYNNLRKIIYLLVSTGLAEIVLVAIPIIVGIPLPFKAVQLLWLNLVTNGIQEIALAFEKGDSAVMKLPPRKPEESIFDKQMVEQVFTSASIMTVITFGCWYLLLNAWQYDETHARVIVIMLMVFLQNFHVLNCRSETASVFSRKTPINPVIFFGITLAQLVHISAAYIPGLKDLLYMEPIKWKEWALLLPAALLIIAGMEIFKGIKGYNKKGPK